MSKVCCAIAGNWACGEKGEWSFDIDKGRLGRLVSINENSTLVEMCDKVGKAFGETNVKTSLSFFNTSFGNTDVGSKMPPFLIETDCGVRNFYLLLVDRSDRNLMVTFSNADDSDLFRTPVNGPRKRSASFNFVSSIEKGDSGISKVGKRKVVVQTPAVSQEDEGFIEDVSAVFELFNSSGKSCASSGQPEKRLTLLDDDDTLDCDAVEAAEELMRKKKGKSVVNEPSFNLIEEVEIVDANQSEVLKGVGSVKCSANVCNEQADMNVEGRAAPRFVQCTSNSVFDYVVQLGGDPEGLKANPKNEKGCGSGSGSLAANGNSLFSGQGWGCPLRREKLNINSGHCGRMNVDCTRREINVENNCDEAVDEESDAEPLFDDTTFIRLETPELVMDDGDEELFVGKTYRNKLECQTAIAIYAIKNMFYYKLTRSNREYIVVNCADAACEWRVSAYQLKDCGYYSIKKVSLDHTCSIETRSQYTKLANHRVIAAMYKPKFITKQSGPRPMDLQQMLLEELRVPSSYTKCWKARETANSDNQGTEEESYLNLLQYLHMLKLANPGTIAEVETEDDGLGGERFLYVFLSFGASRQGFKHLRRVIVLDGAHLGGKYLGVLLTASGQDANFQVFPLAFAVVDSETEAAWTWFLLKVRSIIGDSHTVSIISDRAKSIVKSVKAVYPLAKHGACVVHLARNITTLFKSKGLAKMAIKAACCHTVTAFKMEFEKIANQCGPCSKYLYDAGFTTWTRAYFPGDRYNLMTSNIAESLNNALRKGRNSPIIELLMYIQSMLTRWFSCRRKIAEAHGGLVTPEVDKVISNNLKYAKGSRVTCIEGWRYEVIGQFGERRTVDLKDRRCSCKIYDNLHIPCGHALLAAGAIGLPYGQVCAPEFTTVAWRDTYKGCVQPHENPKGTEMPEEVRNREIMPPKTRRPAGRPKEKRIPSAGEISGGSSQKGSSNRCGRCGGLGHNKSTCKNPI